MSKIYFPYKGARHSWFVYHPAKHGFAGQEGQWERAVRVFQQTLNDFCAVAELYTDQQTLSERVAGEKWRKDIMSFVSSIEKDGKDVYVLEALAESIFDRDKKTEQRETGYHSELTKRASEIKAEDYNLSLGGGAIDPSSLIKRGWGS